MSHAHNHKYEKMSEEISSKMFSCETPEELLNVAAEYGVELSDEELSMINGGSSDSFQAVKDNMKKWFPFKSTQR